MMLSTARTAAAVLLTAALAACTAGEEVLPTSSTTTSNDWDMDWSTPHTRPGEPVTGSVDLEEQAIALGRKDVLAEPVPGHAGWTRLTIRRGVGTREVTGTSDYPSFDYEAMSDYYSFRTYQPGEERRQVTGPNGNSGTTAFEREGWAVICVRFNAAGSGMLTNSRLGLAFVAPADQADDVEKYVHGLAVTDPRTHTKSDSPRVTVELGYLGSSCAGDTAALARCEDGTTPRMRDENWGPGYDLSTFSPTGKTPQGYDYQLKKVMYRQCTNECHDEPAVQLWVRVPANAHGTHPELFLLWSQHTSEDGPLRTRANQLQVRA